MLDLQKHEQFEIEVLSLLSKKQLLNPLTFGGGTCLRLCFGLNRYSVDLDFWQREKLKPTYFQKIKEVLQTNYKVTDHHEKHFSLLAEFSSPNYPRKLKIEIRKEIPKSAETELNIAFSHFCNDQIRLRTFSLIQLFQNKLQALIDRQEIRDAYDLEFMARKIPQVNKFISAQERQKILEIIENFSQKDFKIKLGSLLESAERKYYNEFGFKILKNIL